MNRAVRSISLASAALLMLSGCATDSSKKTAAAQPARSNSGGPSEARAAAFPIDSASWAKLGYRWDWTGFPYVIPKGRITDLVAYPDVIVAQDSGSTISVLEASNGSQRWSNMLATPLTRFVGTTRTSDPAKGDVFLSCSQSEIYFLAAPTGELLDRQKLEKVVNTQPLMAGDRAIFGTPVGEVFCHWLGRSIKVWGFGTGAAVEADLIRVSDTTIASVNQAGLITFLTDSGSLVAQGQIFGPPGAPLAAGNSMLFIASVDQSLYAYSADGRQLWRLRTNAPLTEAPLFHDNVVYCSLAERGMSAFNAANGKPLWNNLNIRGHAVAFRKGRLLVHDNDRLATLDPASGQIIDGMTVDGLQELVTDKVVDGNLYAVSASGVVAKFLPR